MVDPQFFYQVTLHQGISSSTVNAQAVQNLPSSNRVQQLIVMVFTEENGYDGMFLWSNQTRTWRQVLPAEALSKGIIDGYSVDIYYDLPADVPVTNDKAIVFRNAAPFSGTTLTPGNGLIYTVMVPVFGSGEGTVKSINGIEPDVNGNVTITGVDISGVVLAVNGVQPDASGLVTLAPSDIGAIPESEKGQPNGVATLGPTGTIPPAQLPPGIIGGMQYQGKYDAATNTPALPTPSAANKGWYWVVSVAGTYQGLTLGVGDWIVSNGTTYDEIDNQSGIVLTVNGASPDPSTGNVLIPVATDAVAGTVYVPANSGGLLLAADGKLTIDTAALGTWTTSGTVWVDLNGDSVNGNGSFNNPYKTIGQAVDFAPAGSVIMISPGQYSEDVILTNKNLWLKGWESMGNAGVTVIAGNVTLGGTNPMRMDNIAIVYSGTSPALSITQVGTTAGFKFENLVIQTNNTQTAIQFDGTRGAWTGSAYFNNLYVSAGKINHAAGSGYVTVRNFPSDSAAVLEVNGGTADYSQVWHLNSVLHTAGNLALYDVRSVGTDPGVAAITSTADNTAGNQLALIRVSTWNDAGTQSFINKTGNCPYAVTMFTRNLANDVWTGTMLPVKTDQDQDTVVAYAGTNYTGTRGSYLFNHLQGIDNALGARLSAISSVGTGTSLVSNGAAGEIKSIRPGNAGIQVFSTVDTFTINNSGVIALSNVGGTGTTSLVNDPTGQLKSIQGAGGLTISESGGVITLTSSQASTGVTTLNGLSNAVDLTATSPLAATVNGQNIELTYAGLRSLNGVVGAGQVVAGAGIDVTVAGQSLTVTNTGVRAIQVTGTDFTQGVILAAGTNVTLDKDIGTNTITINSSGGGAGGVSSLNNLQGALTIASGSGITVSAQGSTITVSAAGAANPVASLNTLTGPLTLVGDGGIDISASGSDTLIIKYDGGASVAVTSLNTMTGPVVIGAGSGISIDDTTTPGQITINNTQSGLQTVTDASDSTVGSVGLVADQGTGGVATIKKLLPGPGVSFIDSPTGVQLVISGGSGSGSVNTVAGIAPDASGNVPLTAQDLGALKADGTVPFTADQDAAGFTVNNLVDPTLPQQPVTLNYMTTLNIDQGTF